MNKQSAENYLDELLNSVNKEEVHNDLVKAVEEKEEDFVKELEEETSSPFDIKMSPKAEAEFLMEFEQELAGEDFDDFLKEFEESDIQPEDRLENSDVQITEEDALLSMLGGDLGDIYAGESDHMSDELPEEMIEEIPEELSLEDLAFSALEGMEEPDLSAGNDVAPADAIDLSQMGDEDLINLLAGADDLADIGALLSQSDNNTPIDSEDAFAAFAANEMSGQAEESNHTDEPKAKKGGFFDKIKTLLFGKGDDEEEATVETTTASSPVGVVEEVDALSLLAGGAPGVEELTDENAQILAAFAEADRTGASDPGEEKGKGKGKKEKKKKEPKPKKPKAPKAPKKPKEKKPKVKDNTPPLPKGPVIMVCLLAISIFVLVFFGSDLIGYSSSVSKANELYKMGQYKEAAEQLNGLAIKDEDSMLYGKIMTLASVDSEISSYEIFIKNDKKAEALDALICAAGRCELNEENTLSFDCAGEMGILKDGIVVDLEAQFGMSYDEAVELYKLTERNRDEYTIALDKIIEELGIE